MSIGTSAEDLQTFPRAAVPHPVRPGCAAAGRRRMPDDIDA